MAHAKAGPSGASRWLACTPSVAATADLPDDPSPYAAEGTTAHSVAELCVQHRMKQITKRKYTQEVKKLDADSDMELHGAGYAEYIREYIQLHNEPFWALETVADYGNIVPGQYGTCDCFIISEGRLDVIDYKYGMGVPVSAENNPQLRLYAIGILNMYGMLYNIHDVVMHIYQPRINNVQSAVITYEELMQWAEEVVRPRGAMALAGEGEFVAGEHCRFCKIRGTCRARAEHYKAVVEKQETPAHLLSIEEVSQILTDSVGMEAWLKDVQTYALNHALDGNDVPGYKLVEAVTRRKLNEDALRQHCENEGVAQEKYLRSVLETTGNLEKALGKDTVSRFCNKPAGAPVLAPLSDKREPYNPAKSVFEAID